MGERKFSEELEIKLDDHQNNIANIESILEKIKKIDDETELKNVTEYYFRIIENYDMINKEQLRDIVDALKKQKENLINISPQEDLKDKIERIKSDNDNFRNFSIVETSKEDNDKTDGLRRDVTYLEFNDNGNKILYEVENLDLVNKTLSDFDLLANKNSYEIINMLSGYLKKCDTINMKTNPSELPTENYNEEMKQVSSSEVRNVISNNDNMVLKERVDFKDFVNKYKQNQEISYALNSNGERIYLVGEEKYKYVGEERELKKLTQDGKDDNDMNVSNFNSDMKGKGKINEINLEEFTHISYYIGKEDLIIYIMKAMDYNIGISEKQNDFLARFISFCMEYKAIGVPIPGESLNYLYEKFMLRFGESKLTAMITKMKPSEKKKEEAHELKLTPPKNNKLSNWEKAGFISVTVILESVLILGGIFAILALVKK